MIMDCQKTVLVVFTCKRIKTVKIIKNGCTLDFHTAR